MRNNREFATEQEEFWAGEFGDQYTERSLNEATIANSVGFFATVLSRTRGIKAVIEFGANVGYNLAAIKYLLPGVHRCAVEINPTALERLRLIPGMEVCPQSILQFEPSLHPAYDLVLVKGLLIHINPDSLPKAYDVIHASSRQYICIAEYYNPTPMEVLYRGHHERLWKRDFAGDMLDRYPDLNLVDYGFVYRRAPCFALDDITWFLLERTGTTPA